MADISKIELEDVVYDIKDTTARSDITTLSSALNGKISNVTGITTENFKVYLDADTGSDDNNGLTNANAMKTLDGVFEKYGNKGQTNLWLFFNPGDYELNCQNLNNFAMHWMIKSNTNGNVTITFKNTMYDVDPANVDIAFYECHLKVVGNYASNSQKIFLKGSNTCRRIYFDSGGLATEDGVELQDLALAFHGSCLEARRTTIPELQTSCSALRIETSSRIGAIEGYSSTIYFGNNTTFTQDKVYNTQNNQITLYNCEIQLGGVTYIDLQETPSKPNFINMLGGRVGFSANFNKNGSSTYTGNSTLNSVVMNCNQNHYNSFKAVTNSVTVNNECIYRSDLTL